MKALWSPKARFERMLKVELLVLEGWSREGLFKEEVLEKLKREASLQMERVQELEERMHHDVGAFLWAVAERMGEEGRWLHFGLTSYDVVDAALALTLVDAADILIEGLQSLQKTLKEKAYKYKDTLCIGRTHGVWAEPTTFGLKILVWTKEVARNIQRMKRARENIGYAKISGAVGNYAHIPPSIEEYVCNALGLKRESPSTQIVQRDRHADYLCTLAIIASSLEKFATEIRNLSRDEIGEVHEHFAKEQMGSTAMPHKRNPIISERICGLARVVRSLALTSLENVALWHERDITHSAPERVLFPTSCILLDYMIRKFTEVVAQLHVDEERMRENIEDARGLVFSQRLLLELIKRGRTRKEAYEYVKALCEQSRRRGVHLKEILKEEGLHDILKLEDLFDLNYYRRWVNSIFNDIKE